jgi:hypothetical protein
MRRIARLWFIVFTVLRFGLDEVVLRGFRQPWVRALVRVVTVGRRFDEPRGVRLRRALERLGPIFVKFGQVLSTRRDLVPPDLADELARLQDRVPPFPAAHARRLVERALGRGIDEVFEHFEAEPAPPSRRCIARACARAWRAAPRPGARWLSRCCARACSTRSSATWICCTPWRAGSSA